MRGRARRVAHVSPLFADRQSGRGSLERYTRDASSTESGVATVPRREQRCRSAEQRGVLQHSEVDDPASESGRSTEGPGREVARREAPTLVGADRLVVVEAEELDATVAPAAPLGDREPGETQVAVDAYETLVDRLEDEVHAGGGGADHVGDRCSPDGVVGGRRSEHAVVGIDEHGLVDLAPTDGFRIRGCQVIDRDDVGSVCGRRLLQDHGRTVPLNHPTICSYARPENGGAMEVSTGCGSIRSQSWSPIAT